MKDPDYNKLCLLWSVGFALAMAYCLWLLFQMSSK